MTPEEYQRLKEAEKEHLRQLKELKQTARTLERRNEIARTLGDMVSLSRDALDTQERMVEQLAQETARQEARLELALEAQAEREADAEAQQQLDAAEEELTTLRARQLLRQLKQQMGVPDEEAEDATSASASALPEKGAPEEEKEPIDDAEKQSATPDKTLGPRSASSPPSTPPQPEPDALPEKTIGRMKQ